MKKDLLISIFFRAVSYTVFAIIVGIFATFIIEGVRYFSPEFLFSYPKNGMKAGGIFPAIVGSMSFLVLSLLFAIPVGIGTGIFLSEYGKKSKIASIVLISITSLAGIPSIVFGLFGLSIFCITLGFKTSIISGSLTLAIMVLPVIASAVFEGVNSIPREIRESAYALGAKKTEVIFKILIPYSLSRIITAIILGGGRVIGETAPLLLTGAVFFSTKLPGSIFDPAMALPTHIYYLATAYGKDAQWMAKGSSAFLMIFVLVVYLIAFQIRRKTSAGKK